MTKTTEMLTRGIVNCRCSAYSSGIARIKSSCNLIENRFEMPNVSYTQPLGLGEKDDDFNENDAKFATSFAELISIALLNSKNLEALKNRELELQKLNSDKNKFFSIIMANVWRYG